MINLKEIEKNEEYREKYKACLVGRKMDASLLDKLLADNKKRKLIIGDVETKKAEQNKMSKSIALMKKNKEDASKEIEEMQSLSQKIKELQASEKEVEQLVEGQLLELPNIYDDSVAVGSSEEDNKIIRTVGEIKDFSFAAKEHWQLGEEIGGIDFERAGKVTGARFAFLKGGIAKLERALINFMLNVQTTAHGYQEIVPPYMVNTESMIGTGQFPKFKADSFQVADTDYHLIPTAEVPVTNYFAGEVLTEGQLPERFAGFSPCFRSEAGSYGRDTKGLIRQHQFHKVEMLVFSHPEESYKQHEMMTGHAERVLELLGLPYRVALLCSGDIGFGAAKCHDLEVWLPGQNKYREISSCSNCEDFQARRANIRFKPKGGGKPQFVHTLNGSGLAVGRTLVAVLENYQQEDGSILVPAVLQDFMGCKEIKLQV